VFSPNRSCKKLRPRRRFRGDEISHVADAAPRKLTSINWANEGSEAVAALACRQLIGRLSALDSMEIEMADQETKNYEACFGSGNSSRM
jgi:hypothetical protein